MTFPVSPLACQVAVDVARSVHSHCRTVAIRLPYAFQTPEKGA